MNLRVVFNISVVVCLVQLCHSKDFPKEITRCRPTDEDCLIKTTNDIIHSHPNGYPALHVGNLEPFRIDDIKIDGDPSTPVNFNLEMTDLTLSGLSNMTFSKISGFKNDPKDLKVDSEAVCDYFRIQGKYKISGKMLVFPITGEGDITCSINGLHIKTRSKPKVETRDGQEYLKVDYLKIKSKADQLSVEMTNLFNGDKVLGENMLKIINDNWQVLWDEIEPKFIEQFTKVNKEGLDEVFKNFAYKEMFIIDE